MMWYKDAQGVTHPLRYRKSVDVVMLLAYIDAYRDGIIIANEEKSIGVMTVSRLIRTCKQNGVRLVIRRNRMNDTRVGVLKLTYFVTQIDDIYIKGNEVYVNVK